MINIFLISVGGFFGAICRFAVNTFLSKKKSLIFPLGTLAVNLIGSFLLGILIGAEFSGKFYSMLGIGFMGAFTTFSTFMLESFQLKAQSTTKMSLYMIVSYVGGIGLAYWGIILAN